MKRIAGLVVGMLGASVANVEAEPATVVVPQVDVRRVPVEVGLVLRSLLSGDTVCTLDEAKLRSVGGYRRRGWLAIQLPGAVGYVPEHTVVLVKGESTSCISTDAVGTQAAPPAQQMPGAASDVDRTDGAEGVNGVAASEGPSPVEYPLTASGSLLVPPSLGPSFRQGTSAAASEGTAPVEQPLAARGSLLARPPSRISFSLGTGIISLQEVAAKRRASAIRDSRSMSASASSSPTSSPSLPAAAWRFLPTRDPSVRRWSQWMGVEMMNMRSPAWRRIPVRSPSASGRRSWC